MVRAVFLKAREEIETVEAHAFHGRLPVESERRVLAFKPPAELPMWLDDERRNGTLFRDGTNQPVRFGASEQII